MNTRNYDLEKLFISWLKDSNVKCEDTWDKAIRMNAAAALYRATGDQKFADILVSLIENEVKDNAVVFDDNNDCCNFMVGNACYAAFNATKDKKYEDMAKQIASLIDTQMKSTSGYFVNKADESCLCCTYCTQPFFMNYETKNGGKERYNTVIAQYNAIDAELYEATAEKAKENSESLEQLKYYAAGLIDTMEVMEQPLYEIFRRMQDIFKKTIKTIISIDKADGKILTQDLIYCYAILKGCRMKALQTEKYETIALDILDKVSSEFGYVLSDDVTFVAVYAMCYSESIKNREYQDYGRGKGGVLWS